VIGSGAAAVLAAGAGNQPHGPISIELEECDLWRRFHEQTNEMIVTKGGRRMFPLIKVKIKGLEPTSFYSVLLEFKQIENNRWKYINGEWLAGGKSEPPPRAALYTHPDSPNYGSHWSKEPINFQRVKLTNKICSKGKIMLNSLHKYEPRIHVVKVDQGSNQAAPQQLIQTFAFPTTQFIAVTAYQNEDVTALKIKHNPFAKAFQQDHNGASGHTADRGSAAAPKRAATTPTEDPLATLTYHTATGILTSAEHHFKSSVRSAPYKLPSRRNAQSQGDSNPHHQQQQQQTHHALHPQDHFKGFNPAAAAAALNPPPVLKDEYGWVSIPSGDNQQSYGAPATAAPAAMYHHPHHHSNDLWTTFNGYNMNLYDDPLVGDLGGALHRISNLDGPAAAAATSNDYFNMYNRFNNGGNPVSGITAAPPNISPSFSGVSSPQISPDSLNTSGGGMAVPEQLSQSGGGGLQCKQEDASPPAGQGHNQGHGLHFSQGRNNSGGIVVNHHHVQGNNEQLQPVSITGLQSPMTPSSFEHWEPLTPPTTTNTNVVQLSQT